MCVNPIYLKDKKMLVPCRKCSQCKLNRARDFAVRCYFESLLHRDNSFITLTYDVENNPQVLKKEHFVLFLKNLRRQLSYHYNVDNIKYFGCGEYGETTFRPHFHICLFGFSFPDKVHVTSSRKGYPICKSDFLDKIWQKGICTVQEFTSNTSVYSALYSAKSFKKIPQFLVDFPEFIKASQNLGVSSFEKKAESFLQTDTIYIDGKSYKIPNYYLNKLFVTFSEDGKILSKDDKLIDLKNERFEKSLQTSTTFRKFQEDIKQLDKYEEYFKKFHLDLDYIRRDFCIELDEMQYLEFCKLKHRKKNAL